MNKNEIALSFEQAEYYTLQEACDYLNMKHSITNITVKKLFPKILKYQTRMYFYAKGFSISADFVTHQNYKDMTEQEKEYIRKVDKDVISFLNRTMNDDEFETGSGLLFLIDNEALKGLRFLKPITFYNEATPFCGILSLDRLTDEPDSLNFFPKNIDRIVFKDMFGMAIYPRFYISDDENIEELFDKSTLKVSKYEVYENDDGYYIETWHEIGINDLIVLHKDLMELENNIISNNPSPQN